MFFKSSSTTSQATKAQLPATVAEDRERDWAAPSGFGGFETFGRGGLDLGGLHRDQQWVGAWGGRC